MTDDIQKILRELHDDPEMFVRHVLHATPQSWQAEALRAAALPEGFSVLLSCFNRE